MIARPRVKCLHKQSFTKGLVRELVLYLYFISFIFLVRGHSSDEMHRENLLERVWV